jgi:multidrug efflux system membrane fusion protein
MTLPVSLQRIAIALLLLFTSASGMAGEAQGVLHWAAKTSLSLPVSGVVDQVLVTPGQVVKQNELMLQLDTRRVKAQLAAAQARLGRFKPGRDEAQRELERSEELFDRTVLSEVELQQAKIDFAEKEAALREARAAMVQAGLDLEYSELKAPFELMVLKVHVVKGQAIINELQSVPLIDIAENRLVASVLMPATKLVGARTGTRVTISHAGKKIPGTISTVDYNPATQQSMLTITISDQQSVAGAAGVPVLISWP